MNKTKKINIGVVVLLAWVFIIFTPYKASAASVYLQSSKDTISVGDTIVLSVKINSEASTINTVDGEVVVKSGGNNVDVKEFSLANSAFGLWPRTPSLSSDGQTISFVGGVPGGFNIEGATIFKIIFQAKKEGKFVVSPQNIIAYSNDGKGTKIPVTMKDLTINVTPKKAGTTSDDEWASIVAKDVTPPEDFIVVIGQDNSMFDGKKFAYFSALDNQTGIAYYEVSENSAPAIRTGSTYVLQNQTGNVNLVVTAYDKAGNKKVSHYSNSKPFFADISWLTVIIGIIIGAIVAKIYKWF